MSKAKADSVLGSATDLTDRLDAVSERMSALRRTAQEAQTQEALTRFRLTEALHEVLAARARDRQLSRESLFQAYLRQAPRQVAPSTGRLDRIVCRVSRLLGREPAAGGDKPVAGLFDAAWYGATYPDVAATGVDPLKHFLANGCAEGRSPNRLFDTRWYAETHSAELAAGGLSAVAHYLNAGAAAGYTPHPLFDPAHYIGQGALPSPGEDALAHYLREGQGLDPHPLFDADWYRSQLSTETQGEALLSHYLREGWRQGLRPHRLFDPAWYAERYELPTDVEPLGHFVLHGAALGFDPSPWFDTGYYLAHVGDLPAGRNPLVDYIEGGAWRLPQTKAGFSTAAYLASHPQLAGQGLTPLEHWASAAL